MQQETSSQPKSRKRGDIALKFDDLPDAALIPIVVVMDVVGKRKTSIYAGVKSGKFPTPEKFGTRCTRWRVGTVRKWLASPLDYNEESL